MPRRYYKHACSGGDVKMASWSPCEQCGAAGTYTGWGFSVIELWGHFKRLYDLPPYGPHAPFVNGLGITEWCPVCSGAGVFDIDNGRDYEICPACDGVRRLRSCSPENLAAVQQIARLIIDLNKQKPRQAGDTREPVDRVLDLIADEPLRVSARRLLEERRFTDVTRILAWQGILDPITPPGVTCDLEDEDEDEVEDEEQPTRWMWECGDTQHRRPDPPSIEEISRELHRLRDLGFLGD